MKTIVVATDFSKVSAVAMRGAAKLAKTLKAKILLVFVQNTTDMRFALQQGIPLDFQNSAELKKELVKFINRKFKSFIRKYDKNNLKIQTVVLKGIPWVELNKFVVKRKANLVIVGSRGFSPVKTFFVGSTTQNLIRVCTVPVVVIHKQKAVLRKKVAA